MAVYYDGQVITNQLAYAAVGNWIINKLKATSLIPFINKQSKAINHVLAIGISAISAIGINYSYSYDPSGILDIHLTGITIIGIAAGMWQWFISYVMQQGVYNIMKIKEENLKS